MKIFSWVHRKLNGHMSSLQVPLPPRKDDIEMSQTGFENERAKITSLDAETQALLGWKDGLLAIGTLGCHSHPPLMMHSSFSFQGPNSMIYHQRIIYNNDDDDEEEEEYQDDVDENEMLLGEEEENPLVFSVSNTHEIEEEGIVVSVENESKNLIVGDVKEDSAVISERTTLADLFEADATDEAVPYKCVAKPVMVRKEKDQMGKKKFTASFPPKIIKKLIPSLDGQPIKKLKLNNMMRKMMKRKIHPVLNREKSDNGFENQMMPSINELQVSEGMALLQTESV